MLFERPESGELSIVVHIDFPDGLEQGDPEEFYELVVSAGGDPAAVIIGSRDQPTPKYFVGTGKLEEIRDAVQTFGAELVLFNHALSPSQERNLEQALECRVIDRTGLILDIFAQRARTHEGKLQVELAQLEHQATRLVRGWTHLERQKGGIGLRGPGETQLESDRRMLRARIKAITKRLTKVKQQRAQNRRARMRSQVKTCSLVGYTNAGKSSLFNALTQSDVYAADQLFATLDPTLRKLVLPVVGDTVIADTVGFIRHLPHKLIESFHATLLETSEADLLIHVADCSSDDRDNSIHQVNVVLKEIGADRIPTLEVFNKIDLTDNGKPRVDRREDGTPYRVWVSARQGLGLDLLIGALSELLKEELVAMTWPLDPNDGRLRALFYEYGLVEDESYDENGAIALSVKGERQDIYKVLKKAGLSADKIEQSLSFTALGN